MSRKQLIVLTGPPGAGKLEYAKQAYRQATVYESSLNNRSLWRDQTRGTAVFITAAPAEMAKRYWVDEGKRFGFEVTVLVLSGVRAEEASRLISREPGRPSGNQRARITKRVSRWYSAYEPYDDEVVINASNQSVSKARNRRAASTG